MDAGNKYCHDVLSGKIIACDKIKKACQRHLDDLKKVGNKDFPYYYDEKIVKKVLSFISIVPDVDKGVPIDLMPFQKWILAMLFGWRRTDGGKRWRNGFISMARTNSKTQIASWLCLYDFLFGTPANNRQIICASNSMDQADRLFSYCWNSLDRLSNRFDEIKKVVDLKYNEILIKSQGSFIRKVSEDTKGVDSIHSTFCDFDEGHQAKTRSLMSRLQSGMVGNDEALLLQTSTAGVDPKVPLYDDYVMLSKVLDGKIRMDDYFVAIWEQDSESEMNDPKTWEKSNPLMAYPPKKKSLTKGIISERDKAIAQKNVNAFLVKNLNLWRQASEDSMINVNDWNETVIDKPFDIDQQDVFIGIDLSKSNDTTAIGFVYPFVDHEDGKNKFYIDAHSFIATRYGGIEEVEKTHQLPYRRLEREGYCDITRLETGIIDIDFVYEWLCSYIEDHDLNVKAIGYDDWNFNPLIAKIERDHQDWLLVGVRQGTKTLNTPTREMRMQIYDKKILHGENPILRASFLNAILLEDNNGLKIDKKKNANKIDCVDAVIDAFTQGYLYFDGSNEDDDGLPKWDTDQWNEYFKHEISF